MVDDGLQERKRAARARARHILSELNPKRRARAALDASKVLRFSNIWAACDCLLAYMPLGLELDCVPAIQLALNEDKKVFIPKTFGENMVFFRIFSGNGPFVKGLFGIREPVVEGNGTVESVWEPGKGLSLVLTPGLLFDKGGGRLGRGGGYFDRFIRKFRSSKDESNVASPIFVGYAYDEQLVERMPKGSKDELLDGVSTDLRFLRRPAGWGCLW